MVDLAAKNIGELLAEAETRNELRTVSWRFIGLLVLAISVSLEPDTGSHRVHLALVAAYAGTTLVAVTLVLVGLFRSWLNWMYVTIDAGLVVYLAAEHMFLPGASVVEALATPSLAVAFVLLSHASMRMRAGPVLGFSFLVVLGLITVSLIAQVEFRTALTPADMHSATVRLMAFGAVSAIQVMLVFDIKRLLLAAVSSSTERTNLAQFFAPQMAERIAVAGAHLEARRHDAAVLFVDIRGFTGMAETMPLEDVVALLSDYRERVVETVAEWGGTVDKFIGDGIMAVFGFPEPGPDDATRCFDCACDLMCRLATWSEIRIRDGKSPVRFGAGMHFGQVIGGVIPGGPRSEYTVVGDAVNLSARLEEMSKTLEAQIVASEQVVQRLPKGRAAGWRSVSQVAIPGRSEVVDLWYMRSEPA